MQTSEPKHVGSIDALSSIQCSLKGNGDAWKDHIAIVGEIPDDPASIRDPATYMDQMILIEAECTSKIQGAIKKLSVGDYNYGELVMPREIYADASYPKDGLDLKCQSWAIGRLLCTNRNCGPYCSSLPVVV